MLLNKIIGISLCSLFVICSCQQKSNENLTVLLNEAHLNPDSILAVLDSIKQQIPLNKQTTAYWNLIYVHAYDEKNNKLPPDSIVYKATDYFLLNGKSLELAYSFFYHGRLLSEYNNENDALDYYLKALELAKQEDNFRLSGQICSYMGKIYWEDEQYQEYIDILKQGVDFFNMTPDTRSQILSYRDISRGFLYQLEYDSALVYCKEGEIIARKVNDTEAFIKIYYEIGSIYWVKKDYDLAKLYITKALEATEDPDMRIKQKQLLTSIYIGEGKYKEAKELLTPLLSNENIPLIEKVANCHRMSNIEKGLLNYEEALRWYKEHKILNDVVLYQRMNIDTKKVKIYNELEKLINKNKQLKRYNICSVFLISISFVIITYFLLKSRKYYKKLLISENENTLLHNEQMFLQGELLKRSDFLQKATLLLNTPTHKRKELETKMEKIFATSKITEKDWEELEALVDKAQNDFATRLRKRYINLTEEEIRTLILIRLGINNNYLATLYNIQIDSIMTKRYRIRKKIGIPKEISLEEFINQPFKSY